MAVGGADVEAVGAVASSVEGGFYLDAFVVAVVLDADVVAALAEGAGDQEAFAGGAGHEGEFGPVAALFGVGETVGRVHGVSF